MTGKNSVRVLFVVFLSRNKEIQCNSFFLPRNCQGFTCVCRPGRGGGGGGGLMGTCGQPGYVFRDFCLEQGVKFIIFCLNQGIDLSIFVLNWVKCLKQGIKNRDSVLKWVGRSAIFVLNRVRV